MKTKTKVAFFGLLPILAAILVLPFLLPLDFLLPRAEKMATDAAGVPVRIGSLRLFVLPLPHLTAADIQVGTGQARVAKVAAYPGWGAMLRGQLMLARLELDDLEVQDSAAGVFTSRTHSGAPAAVQLPRRIQLNRLKPVIGGKPAGVWNAELRVDDSGRMETARLASTDGRLTVALAPEGRRWALVADAKDWTLPVGRPLVVSGFRAKGHADAASLDLPEIEAVLYGGTIKGELRAGRTQGLRLDGKFRIDGVDIAPLLQAAGGARNASGSFSADALLSGRGAHAAALFSALRVDGRFSVAEGVLRGVDLTTAAANLLGAAKSGGETRFDNLHGRYSGSGKTLQLRELVASSGLFEAKGRVDIGPGGALSGTLDVDLRKTRGFVGVPLALAGTVRDPSVRPTKGSAIGAAVGTVVLPGVGTSLGASIGRFFEKKTEK